MKAMETLQDLIEEAKLRMVYWSLCIFAVSYFLTHTSKSMWMNIPLSILFVSALRVLFSEVEFRWKVRKVRPPTYLSHLEKKQLPVDDPCLSTLPPPPNWKRKIDSPVVEAAMEGFVNKLLQDFVSDLWYSDITPDKEAPELMRAIIMDVLGEISGRVKEINLVDFLTRDLVDLVGVHLDIFRRNQAAIGVDVMGTLSSKERDDRLRHHLEASRELHPACLSPESEYKVLQHLVGGLLAVVLRPQEAQCPLVRCIARELITCLVMQPVMSFASPEYVNELIEYVFLSTEDGGNKVTGDSHSPNVMGSSDHTAPADIPPKEYTSRQDMISFGQGTDLLVSGIGIQKHIPLDTSKNLTSNLSGKEHPVVWAQILEAATQRRTEVLMPENLENMWTKGKNYKKKAQKIAAKSSRINSAKPSNSSWTEMSTQRPVVSFATEDSGLPPKFITEARPSDGSNNTTHLFRGLDKEQPGGKGAINELENTASFTLGENKGWLKRSNSTSALKVETNMEKASRSEGVHPLISEFYSPDFDRQSEAHTAKGASNMVFHSEVMHAPKLWCRVEGAYFEKLGSKSFAVYSILVTDADNNTWSVRRRYSNFERLHRHLKDIPNYTLHLPPKRIFSSSTEDALVHQRCIQLDKYLQDLVSIANVAEQHEVWDFLSASSKNYSFGKSSSAIRTLAVNVDEAMDDIVRQFKGVSDGLMRKVVGSSSLPYEASSAIAGKNLSWNADEVSKHLSWHSAAESAKSISDEDVDKDGTRGHEEVGPDVQANGWHSDNELDSKGLPPRVVKHGENFRRLYYGTKHGLEAEPLSVSLGGYPATSLPVGSDHLEDPAGVPPEWTPPNLSIPVLNLVDNIFQLKRRGWLRRQVFWISKQILQLMMEDAIDDWLLRQIQQLRRDDIIAQGIQWVQDALWPDGTFFLRSNPQSGVDDCQFNESSQTTSRRSRVTETGSFEQQLEAARRAHYVKKMIFNGAPAPLVSLIGRKQYRRCAKDIHYFLQSTVCLKQLAYEILELILKSAFPELGDIVLDVHGKQLPTQPAV
ncbi:uncharacterized protein LOC127807780 [Diospyros lotus]|uniref:uncharacterized protein LOC127807780 n=1 Tax=Diospyros lotus TaxID=55363 RepID=UPI002253D58F|nr:uncharacterized protein LOC127807780 [Diospyros lotus]